MKKNIGEIIRDRRKQLGMTQIQLAERAKVSKGTIGNIEAGIRKQPREIWSIAKALALDLNEFFQENQKATHSHKVTEKEASYVTNTENPKRKILWELFESLPQKDQDEIIKSMFEKKKYYDELIAELTKSRRIA